MGKSLSDIKTEINRLKQQYSVGETTRVNVDLLQNIILVVSDHPGFLAHLSRFYPVNRDASHSVS